MNKRPSDVQNPCIHRVRVPATAYALAVKVERLFERVPSWGVRNNIEALAAVGSHWAQGALIIRPVRVPQEAIWRALEADRIPYGRESVEHRFLKEVAVQWLVLEGHDDAGLESPYGRRRYDAGSSSADWFFEVGTTYASKVRELVWFDTAPRLTLIPYTRTILDILEGRSRSLYGFDFAYTEEGAEAVRELHNTRMAKAAKSLELNSTAEA